MDEFQQKQAQLRIAHAKRAVIDAMTAFGFVDFNSQRQLLAEIMGVQIVQQPGPPPEPPKTPATRRRKSKS